MACAAPIGPLFDIKIGQNTIREIAPKKSVVYVFEVKILMVQYAWMW